MTDNPLAEYRRSMRRRGRVYYSTVGAVVLALLVVVLVAWSRGEAAHVTLHTATAAPASVVPETPSTTLAEAWRSSDRTAIGAPQYGGTVITYSAHTVSGRDARTGRVTWSYTRSDRTVCTAAQLSGGQNTGTTIAIFALHGNCDELTGLDSSTGQRRWTRTLDMDGFPVDGRPDIQATTDTLMLTQSTVIYAIDPSSGYNRWTYDRPGCRIEGARLGQDGVLISQNCSTGVQCGQLKYCGPGQQLLLRDAYTGNGDTDQPNADQIKWIRRGDADLPVSADALISTLSTDRRHLAVLDQATGKSTRVVPIDPAVPGSVTVSASAGTTGDLLWLGGRVMFVSTDPGGAGWTARAGGPPSFTTSSGLVDTPQLGLSRITVTTGSAVTELDPLTGRARRSYPAAAATAGSTARPLGTGFLVSGPGGVVAYR